MNKGSMLSSMRQTSQIVHSHVTILLTSVALLFFLTYFLLLGINLHKLCFCSDIFLSLASLRVVTLSGPGSIVLMLFSSLSSVVKTLNPVPQKRLVVDGSGRPRIKVFRNWILGYNSPVRCQETCRRFRSRILSSRIVGRVRLVIFDHCEVRNLDLKYFRVRCLQDSQPSGSAFDMNFPTVCMRLDVFPLSLRRC